MKSQRSAAKMILVLGVIVFFSLSAIEVNFKAVGSLKKRHQVERVEGGVDENEIEEIESFEEEERRGNHPYEAMAFRRLQLQDEKGFITPNGMAKARQHVKSMRVSGKADAKQSAGVKPDSWTWLGPGNIGGRIRSIVIHPIVTDRMFVGSVSGGIWRTDNGGVSWFPVNDFMANLAVTSMVIDPLNPANMYAGTGEGFVFNVNPEFGLQGTRGEGIFKSTNGGATWNQLPFTNPTAPPPGGCANPDNCPWYFVHRLAISPNGNTLLAATGSGIYRSTDAGATWIQTVSGQLGFQVSFHPTDNLKAVAGCNGAAFYSTNGGENWSVASFTPAIVCGNPPACRVELAYAPSNPAIVYACVNNNQGAIYRSTDGGQTFTLRHPLGHLAGQGQYDNTLWVNPQDANYIIAGGINLWKSIDGGSAFVLISDGIDSAHGDQHIIVGHPGFNNTTNRTVYFGNDGGIYRAANVGNVTDSSGWEALNNNLGITQFYGAAGNATTGVILGGTQDNGTLRYTGGTGWTLLAGGIPLDGGYCAADPTDTDYFYGEYALLQIHRSTDGGVSGSYIFDGISDAGDQSPNPQRANFIAPFILDPNNSNTMLAGGVSLWRCTNIKSILFAPSWAAVPKPNPASSNISAIAISPITSSLICVGHNNGDIYRTFNGTDAAPSWTKIDTAGLPNRFVTRLVIDSTRSTNWIYATFGSFNGDNIYRTTDNGTTWANVSGSGTNSLPAVPVRSLVYHPRNPNLLYVGTEVGIFSSDDAGATWEVPQGGPANVSVDELFWMGNDLIAVTHGRGIYRASGGIYVDCNYNGIQLGTFDQPYRTVSAAVNAVTSYSPIWLKPCNYNEPMTINKRLELRSLGGTATIGRP